jgi:HSP20 family protein
MYRFIRYSQPLATNTAYRTRSADLEQQINSLFGSNGNDDAQNARSIPVGIHEDKENLYVTADLPGVQRSDLNVEVVENVLRLTAIRKVPGVEGEQTVSFARNVNLLDDVQTDKISAELKDGVLRLTLPKAEAVKPRRVEIK